LVSTQLPSLYEERVGRGPRRGESLRKQASSPQPSPPSCVRRTGRKASKQGVSRLV
jgi:hypothetical protein